MSKSLAVLACAAAMLWSAAATQATVVFADSLTVGGKAVFASASFTISDTTLPITLQKASPGNCHDTPTKLLPV